LGLANPPVQVGGFEAYLLADETSEVEAAEAYRSVSVVVD
jgi:hypothetical protein